MARRAAPSTVDEYIAGFPTGVQRNLRVVRRVIRAAIPEATETIGYQIPAYRLGGPVIYFAAFASHIGLYPAPVGTPALQARLAPYRSGKASLRFPLDEPMPEGLIARVVKQRAKEQQARTGAKAKGRRGTGATRAPAAPRRATALAHTRVRPAGDRPRGLTLAHAIGARTTYAVGSVLSEPGGGTPSPSTFTAGRPSLTPSARLSTCV